MISWPLPRIIFRPPNFEPPGQPPIVSQNYLMFSERHCIRATHNTSHSRVRTHDFGTAQPTLTSPTVPSFSSRFRCSIAGFTAVIILSSKYNLLVKLDLLLQICVQSMRRNTLVPQCQKPDELAGESCTVALFVTW
jgi:hypothetical protein